MIMTKFRKITTFGIVIIILVVVGFSVWFFNTTKKITTYEECVKAGWLVRSISIYDGFELFGTKYECVLWGGKSFVKQENDKVKLEIAKTIKNQKIQDDKVLSGVETSVARDFKSCASAGYPISPHETWGEIYRICKVPSGKTFQEEISVFLKTERGIEIATPTNGQEVFDIVMLRGSIEDARFMQNIWISVWKRDGEYSGYSEGNMLIPVSSGASFETELTFPFGAGQYDVIISAPAIEEHSGDDMTIFKVEIISINKL